MDHWTRLCAMVCLSKWTVFEFQSKRINIVIFFDKGNHVLKFKLCNGLKFNTGAHVTILCCEHFSCYQRLPHG